MTREDIKVLLAKHADNPKFVFETMLYDDDLENGFKVILFSPFPLKNMSESIAIIKDIVDNDRQFYYSGAGNVPDGAKYICDVGVCDAGMLYVK